MGAGGGAIAELRGWGAAELTLLAGKPEKRHLNPRWRFYLCVLNCNCHLIRLMIINNTNNVLSFVWDNDNADLPS